MNNRRERVTRQKSYAPRNRSTLTSDQSKALEKAFAKNHYPDIRERTKLAARFGDLDQAKVRIWFQNRRARHKIDQDEKFCGKYSDGNEVNAVNTQLTKLKNSDKNYSMTDCIKSIHKSSTVFSNSTFTWPMNFEPGLFSERNRFTSIQIESRMQKTQTKAKSEKNEFLDPSIIRSKLLKILSKCQRINEDLSLKLPMPEEVSRAGNVIAQIRRTISAEDKILRQVMHAMEPRCDIKIVGL